MSVLDLPSAKKHLDITSSDYDAELQTFIDAAESAVAQRVGPLSTFTVTAARVPGYAWNLYLPVYPAVSLTSVQVVGSSTTLNLSDLHLEEESGQVSYNGGGFFTASAYDITYTAGRADVPDDLLFAVKEVLRYMWKSQRGGSVRATAVPDLAAPTLRDLLDGMFTDRDELQVLGA